MSVTMDGHMAVPGRRPREWFSLIASVASFVTCFVIPVIKFAVTPTPFEAFTHYEAVGIPSAITKSWRFPYRDNDRRYGATPYVVAPFDAPQEVLIITVRNSGSSVRHKVSMTIDGLLVFAGIELGSLNQSTASATAWLSPEFRRQNGELLLSPIDELPAQSALQVFIWGRFTVFGPEVELRSNEGTASVETLATVGGWPLMLALNAWWVVMLSCAGAGIWFLKRFSVGH